MRVRVRERLGTAVQGREHTPTAATNEKFASLAASPIKGEDSLVTE